MRAVWAVVAGAVSLAAPATAVATGPAPFRVEFGAGLRCGTPEAFAAELVQRSGRARAAHPSEPAFELTVDVRPHEGSLLGRLTLREPNGDVTVRVVPGASCEEVIAALAVIAAVLVEPGPAAPPTEPPPPPVPPLPSEPSPWAIGASVGLLAQGAVAPEVLPGLGAEASVAYESGAILSPMLALGYHHALTEGRATTPNGIAELVWWSFRGSVCPLRWPGDGRLAARPCASFDLGRLEGRGVETERNETRSVLWIAPGLSARFDALPVEWLALTAEAGLFTPLNRDRFVFDPGLEAFRPPPVGGFARLALGGRFQ